MVPHYQQSNSGACLPACARMVLATFGDHRSEAELARIMGSYEFGTPANRITRLEKIGYQVQYRSFSLDELQIHLEQESRCIVFVYAGFLAYADFEGFHALVLTAVDPENITLLDPASNESPTVLSVDEFLLAWEEFDSLAAIISK